MTGLASVFDVETRFRRFGLGAVWARQGLSGEAIEQSFLLQVCL